MLHPFYSTLLTQPGLLVEHLDAYAELARAEAGTWKSATQARWTLKAVIAVSAVLTLAWTAIAVMLVAAIDWRSMPHAWVLLAVPAIPACIALGCWWRLSTLPAPAAFALLREQVATDLKIMRAVDRK